MKTRTSIFRRPRAASVLATIFAIGLAGATLASVAGGLFVGGYEVLDATVRVDVVNPTDEALEGDVVVFGVHDGRVVRGSTRVRVGSRSSESADVPMDGPVTSVTGVVVDDDSPF